MATSRSASEPKYRRVSELVSAGMVLKDAFVVVAAETDGSVSAVRSAYYAHAGEHEKAARAKPAKTGTGGASRPVEADGSLAQALEALAAQVAGVANLVRELEADAAYYRAVRAALGDLPR